jgi:hypothetical protein
MANPLIIKGGIYFNGTMLLKPHYSGYFMMVDCTEYKTKKQIKQDYNKERAKELLSKDNYYLTNEGVKYYECEYGPRLTNDFDLLNDVCNLSFTDEQYEFD